MLQPPIALTSKNSSRPCSPASLPIPECLKPPKGASTAISEVDKNSKINGKEIELLKLQIREIQAKSGNPLSN